MPIVIGLIFIVGLVALYMYSLTENRKTPVPEGCKHILNECSTCHDVSCGHYDEYRK